MKIFKLFKQLYIDYSSIHNETKSFSGSYYSNFKLFLDKTIKTDIFDHFFEIKITMED